MIKLIQPLQISGPPSAPCARLGRWLWTEGGSLPATATTPQVCAAAAIIVITALRLHHVSIAFDRTTLAGGVSNVCLLGSTTNGANLCYLAYGASGVSIIATGALSLLLCCTCNLCGLGGVLDALFAAAGTVLWAITGVVFNFYQRQPGMAAVPRPEWRATIPALSFVACALFGIMCLASLWSLFSRCCGCGSDRRSGGKGARRGADVEHAPPMTAPMGAPQHWPQQQQQPQQILGAYAPQPGAYGAAFGGPVAAAPPAGGPPPGYPTIYGATPMQHTTHV